MVTISVYERILIKIELFSDDYYDKIQTQDHELSTILIPGTRFERFYTALCITHNIYTYFLCTVYIYALVQHFLSVYWFEQVR